MNVVQKKCQTHVAYHAKKHFQSCADRMVNKRLKYNVPIYIPIHIYSLQKQIEISAMKTRWHAKIIFLEKISNGIWTNVASN